MVVGLFQPSTPLDPNSQLRLELDKKSYFKEQGEEGCMRLGEYVRRRLQKKIDRANRLGVTDSSNRFPEIFRTQLYLSQNAKNEYQNTKHPKPKQKNKQIGWRKIDPQTLTHSPYPPSGILIILEFSFF